MGPARAGCNDSDRGGGKHDRPIRTSIDVLRASVLAIRPQQRQENLPNNTGDATRRSQWLTDECEAGCGGYGAGGSHKRRHRDTRATQSL